MTTHTIYPNDVRLTIDKELLQETLVALNYRRTQLLREQSGMLSIPVRLISERQLDRVQRVGTQIAAAIGESF